MQKAQVSTSNKLSLDQILDSGNAIQMAYRLETYGFWNNQDRRDFVNDVSMETFEGHTKTYMKTCLAGLYGWDKVKEWDNIIPHVFMDEFGGNQ